MGMVLSVVIPTHNRAHMVGNAIESVLSQDVGPLEVVVADDCSTDETPEVLGRLAEADGRVKVVRSDSPLGGAGSRNLALDLAEGDVVAFCDDDDTWVPGIARHVLDYLDAHPDLHAVSAWMNVVDGGLHRTATYRGPLVYGVHELLWHNYASAAFAFVRRTVLPFDLRFDPALSCSQDWDLWLRCALARPSHPMHTIPRVGYTYNRHGGPRITNTSALHSESRRYFLAKHRDAMEPACQLYHQAMRTWYDRGRAPALQVVRRASGYAPRERAFVLSLLSWGAVAGRLGMRLGDEGLSDRLAARLVGPDSMARRALHVPVRRTETVTADAVASNA